MSKRNENGTYNANSNFKLPKVFKRMSCMSVNKEINSSWIKMCVQAVMQSQDIPPKKDKKEVK
jgi:hypothetical protein